MDIKLLLSPPIAFLLYIPLVLVLLWVGKLLAGPSKATEAKSSVYGSGEESPSSPASPGYRPFFLIAFFFAIIHLGILVLASNTLSLTAGLYLGGLLLALIALLLG